MTVACLDKEGVLVPESGLPLPKGRAIPISGERHP